MARRFLQCLRVLSYLLIECDPRLLSVIETYGIVSKVLHFHIITCRFMVAHKTEQCRYDVLNAAVQLMNVTPSEILKPNKRYLFYNNTTPQPRFQMNSDKSAMIEQLILSKQSLNYPLENCLTTLIIHPPTHFAY